MSDPPLCQLALIQHLYAELQRNNADCRKMGYSDAKIAKVHAVRVNGVLVDPDFAGSSAAWLAWKGDHWTWKSIVGDDESANPFPRDLFVEPRRYVTLATPAPLNQNFLASQTSLGQPAALQPAAMIQPVDQPLPIHQHTSNTRRETSKKRRMLSSDDDSDSDQFGIYWTRADESILSSTPEWEFSLYEQAWQLYKMVPGDILPEGTFIGTSGSITIDGESFHNPNWSQSLCISFGALLCVPAFWFQPELLRIGIQAALNYRLRGEIDYDEEEGTLAKKIMATIDRQVHSLEATQFEEIKEIVSSYANRPQHFDFVKKIPATVDAQKKPRGISKSDEADSAAGLRSRDFQAVQIAWDEYVNEMQSRLGQKNTLKSGKEYQIMEKSGNRGLDKDFILKKKRAWIIRRRKNGKDPSWIRPRAERSDVGVKRRRKDGLQHKDKRGSVEQDASPELYLEQGTPALPGAQIISPQVPLYQRDSSLPLLPFDRTVTPPELAPQPELEPELERLEQNPQIVQDEGELVTLPSISLRTRPPSSVVSGPRPLFHREHQQVTSNPHMTLKYLDADDFDDDASNYEAAGAPWPPDI